MFNFEKLANSAFFRYTEFLYKIVCINILVLLVSLPIFTLLPALVAGYDRIRFYIEGREAPIFKPFFQSFKKNFWRNVLVELIVMAVGALLYWNTFTYLVQIDKGLLFRIGFLIMFIFVIFFLIMLINLPLTCLYFPTIKPMNVLKISLYMGFKIKLRTILLIFPILISIFIFNYVLPLFSFIGVGIAIYLQLKIASSPYERYAKN